MSAKFGSQPVQGSRVRPNTRTDVPTYTRGTREATGIIRYLIWVSRRYISLGVDGTACSLDFRFCTRVDPWFTVISIKDPLERVPIIPSPLSTLRSSHSSCFLDAIPFFHVNFRANDVARLLLHSPTTITNIHRHGEERKRKRQKEREREREKKERPRRRWETLYRRPVEFSIFLKAP